MRQPNPLGTIPTLLPSINIYQSSRFLYLASVRCRIPVDTRIDSFHALRRLVSALKTGLGPDSRYQRAAITSQNVRALQSRHVEAFNSGLSHHTIPAILCPCLASWEMMGDSVASDWGGWGLAARARCSWGARVFWEASNSWRPWRWVSHFTSKLASQTTAKHHQTTFKFNTVQYYTHSHATAHSILPASQAAASAERQWAVHFSCFGRLREKEFATDFHWLPRSPKKHKKLPGRLNP